MKKIKQCIFGLCFVGAICVHAEFSEDTLTLIGADNLYHNNFAESRDDFLVLFEETKEPYYAKLAAQAAIGAGNFDEAVRLSLLYQNLSGDTNDLQTNKILADAYVQSNNIPKAIEILEKIRLQEESPQILQILGNMYLLQKNFPKALDIFLINYNDEHDIDSLKKIIIIYINQEKPQKALGILSEYLLAYGCSGDFCQESFKIYEDLNGLNMAKGVFEKIYVKNPTIPNATNFIQVLVALKQYQEAQGIAKAFPFDKGLLLDLYVMQGDFKKAYTQAQEIYKESKNPRFLALEAIYEIGDDTKAMTKQDAQKAAKKLEQAMKERESELSKNHQKPSIQDAFFYNFLGFLLIDYELGIQKGINYVKEALNVEPYSIAYLDSLAWGYYKLGNCKEAFRVFLQIPQNQVQKDPELQAHSRQITSCE